MKHLKMNKEEMMIQINILHLNLDWVIKNILQIMILISLTLKSPLIMNLAVHLLKYLLRERATYSWLMNQKKFIESQICLIVKLPVDIVIIKNYLRKVLENQFMLTHPINIPNKEIILRMVNNMINMAISTQWVLKNNN